MTPGAPGPEMIRRPAVAGTFYPADPEALRRDLVALTQGRRPPAEPRGIAVMVPHAGYIYSGRGAGAPYTAIHLPPGAAILCPHPTGPGEAIARDDGGGWGAPPGPAPVRAPPA